MADEYAHYTDQKGWTVDFTVTALDELYFRKEFAGLPFAGGKILEIGFGSGGFLAFARGRGAEVVGVEIQPGIVARARAAGYPAFQSLEALGPEHDGSVDAVVALDVFEHLGHETIGGTLTAINRLLKPGGVLVLRSPNGQSPFGRRTQYGDCTHLTVITPKKMEQLCFRRGLEVVAVRNQARVFASKGPLNALVKRLQFLARDLCNAAVAAIYGMGTRALDENIVIVIRKTGAAAESAQEPAQQATGDLVAG